jgi:putrescine transport system ATP-binding protein
LRSSGSTAWKSASPIISPAVKDNGWRPQLLLLDEPLAALDKKLRESTQAELMELQRRLGLTFIIVTHDQEEAMSLAARIGVMEAGRLEQVATPRELYEAPCSRWIAEFVGDINLFEGRLDAGETSRLTTAPRLVVATRDAGMIYIAAPRQRPVKETLCVAIRPEKVKLSRRAPASDDSCALNRLEGAVTDVSYLGGTTSYKVKLDSGAVLRSSMANTARLDLDAYSTGQRVVAWFSPEDCLVLEQ